MKRTVVRLSCAAFAAMCAGGVLADVTLTASNTEIVAASGAGDTVVKFAAKELADILGQAFGSPVNVVGAPTAGKTSIILGSNTWSRAVGIDTAALERDEFVIKALGGRVYIAGRDCLGPEIVLWRRNERATLFGVYEFLHRFAGVRMYFPGELGTIVPKASSIKVPGGDLKVKPSYSARMYGYEDGTVPDEAISAAGFRKVGEFKRLDKLRHRLETEHLPCCHGQLLSRFYKRFAVAHPEYFLMGEDGKRQPTEAIVKPLCEKEHLCHTSKVWDEIYMDAKAYLMGMPPEVRKIPSKDGKRFVSGPGAEGRYYDVMPHDGLRQCHCKGCQSRYDFSVRNFATDLIWSNTVAVANRLKADGVKGYVLQMAYYPYADVPKFDIPDNVLVMVAQKGPWALEKLPDGSDQDRLVKDWVKKLGHKVWVWTYPNKIFSTSCPDIPQMSPKSWGRYFKRLSGYIIGGFGESESDRWIYNYLNYYVFSRVCWDVNVDIDAVLDEHYRLMYGPAAPQIKSFFESLEDRWVNGMMRNTRLGPLGPEVVLPGQYKVWKEVYSPALMAEYKDIMAKAEAAVKPGSIEARRVALVRKEMFEPLAARAQEAHDSIDIKKSLARWAANAARDKAVFKDTPAAKHWWGNWPKGAITNGRSSRPGPASAAPLEFTVTNRTSVQSAHVLKLNPGRKYRLSCFVRLADMKMCTKWGGMQVRLKGKCLDDSKHPNPRITDAPDWVYVERIYETPASMESPDVQLQCHFFSLVGRAQVDGLRVEEVVDGK